MIGIRDLRFAQNDLRSVHTHFYPDKTQQKGRPYLRSALELATCSIEFRSIAISASNSSRR
jgi:hypothetical protein